MNNNKCCPQSMIAQKVNFVNSRRKYETEI
uniref:Uncharacterized protein n=1 Tax=Myoviridae sp. ctqfO1 TaxID=2827710 RepID=A0A8S5T301_9CAUD|nr:MAG TPA: hypothetical protein [Myoviridae sp. ctqfO1]